MDPIPEPVWERLPAYPIEAPELSSRELAVCFTDEQEHFVPDASAYRLLKACDLIANPAFIVVKTAEMFAERTAAPNQSGQADFTYRKVIGWGWLFLSTMLDDFSRHTVAWKLRASMRAGR